MSAVFLPAAFVLLLALVIGLALVMRAPARGDSLLVALLAATTGVAIILLLGEALGVRHAIDAALVFGLLAAVLGVAFVVRGWPPDERGHAEEERCR